jgi:4-oxalocrotonate tautomerase family enzyme
MPILNYHLVEGQFDQRSMERLLLESSRFFAEVLRCPVERVRVFITLHRPELFAAGGQLCSSSGTKAPYFTLTLLEGRSLEDRHKLLRGLTDIVVDVLEVDRAWVRGGITLVHPENWAIAGEPASIARQAEIRAREAGARGGGGAG